MIKSFLVGLTGLLFTTVAAHSADILAPAPATYDWSGFYFGAQGGWVGAQYSGPFTDAGGLSPTPYDCTENSGFIGGLVGYNYQLGGLVLGMDADLNGVIEGKCKQTVGSKLSYDIGANQTYNGDVRLKVGAAFDRFMPYVAGGLAFGDVQTTYALPGGSPFATDSTSRLGYSLGIGANYAVTNNIILGLEYKYTDLGSQSFTDLFSNTGDNVKFTANTITASLAFKF